DVARQILGGRKGRPYIAVVEAGLGCRRPADGVSYCRGSPVGGRTAPARQLRVPFQVRIRHSLPRVLDARRKRLGDFQQRLLRGALALTIAAASDQLRDAGARLGQRHAGLDAGLTRFTRRGDHASGVAVALEDREILVLELGLATQPRREREER